MFARKKRENHSNAFEVTNDRRQHRHGHLHKDLVTLFWHIVPHVPVAHGKETFSFTL